MAKTSEQKKVDAARVVDVGNIVGLAEIAERTGSTPHAVWNWTKRYEFPKPIATVSGRPVYDWSEVDEWNSNWERSKGGYHTHKTRTETTAKKAAPRRKAAKETTGDDKASGAKKATRPAAKRAAKPAAAAPAEESTPNNVTPLRRSRRASRSS
jgi:predicted DNA-binding transcriptional regulator AlpA